MAYLGPMTRRLMSLRRDSGQTSVEYAAVLALIVIVIVSALALIPGDLFSGLWSTAEGAL
jgi:Flp pilus assembly pilin Flp